MALYSRLFKYRSSDQRAQLENFLTEALVELLDHLPRGQQERLLFDLLLSGSAGSAELILLRDRFLSASSVRWKSQWPVNWGQSLKHADIGLEGDGRLLLIVESKVSTTTFTSHRADEAEESREFTQLEIYGSWLVNRNPNGALILLTHAAQAPADFLADGEKYGVKIRAVSSWVALRRWLSASERGLDPVSQYLSSELTDFLHAEGIHDMDLQDAQVLASCMARKTEIDGAWGRLWQVMESSKESAARRCGATDN